MNKFVKLALSLTLLSSFALVAGCPKPDTPATPASSAPASEVPASSAAPTTEPTASAAPTATPATPTATPASTTTPKPATTATPVSTATPTATTSAPAIASVLGQTFASEPVTIGTGTAKAFATFESLERGEVLINFANMDQNPTLVEALDDKDQVIASTSSFRIAATNGSTYLTITGGRVPFRIRITVGGKTYIITFVFTIRVTQPTAQPTSSPSTSSGGGSSSGGSSSGGSNASNLGGTGG